MSGATTPHLHHAVMVSSTYVDMKELRATLIRAATGANLFTRAMEHDVPQPGTDVIENSLKMVRESAAYVLLIGHRYGQRPESTKRNPKRLSITELEFDEAQRLGRPIQLYLLGDDYPLAPRFVDAEPADRASLAAFRQRAKSKGGKGGVHLVYKVVNSREELLEAAGPLMMRLADYLRSPRSGAVAPVAEAEPPPPIKASALSDKPISSMPAGDKPAPALTRLQAELGKRLKQLDSSASADVKLLLERLPQALSIDSTLAWLKEIGSARATERLRTITYAAWQRRPPDSPTAQLIVLLFLVAVEQRLLEKLSGPAAQSKHLRLSLDDRTLAALLGACLLDRGLHFVIDPGQRTIVARNVISDFEVAEPNTPAHVKVRAELHEVERQLTGRRPGADRQSKLRDLVDDETLTARLEELDSEHGVRLAIALPDGDAAGILQAEKVGPMLLALDVAAFAFGADHGTASYKPELVDEVSRTLQSQLRDLLAVVLGPAAKLEQREAAASENEPRPAAEIAPRLDAPRNLLHRVAVSIAKQKPLLFYSYARHADDKACNDSLLAQLRGLSRLGGFDLWVDTRIKPGQVWDDEIQSALDRATAGVLMLSKHFLASTYIMDVELPKQVGKLVEHGRLMPVVLGDCTWRSFPELKRLQAPLNARPLNKLTRAERDAATAEIAQAVAAMCRA